MRLPPTAAAYQLRSTTAAVPSGERTRPDEGAGLARKRERVSGSRAQNSEELLAKAKLAARIVQIIEGRSLSQAQAATLLGVDQPKVSQIYRGRLDDFSLERLMRFLTALDQNVRIVVEGQPRRGRGRLIVEAA